MRVAPSPPIILFALFVVVLLITLVAGVQVYRSLVDEEDAIKAQRFSTGLMANSIRAADSYDALSSAEGPEGQALVLTEATPAGAVETRLFLTDGRLVQQYCVAGTPFSADDAVEMVQTDTFSFAYQDGLLTLSTDDEEVCVAIRSKEVRL